MKILSGRRSVGQMVGSIFALLVSLAITHAQAPEVIVKLISEEPLLLPEGAVQRILIERDERTISGHLIRTAKKLNLSLPDRPVFELPKMIETMVSEDGKTILQFGDEWDMSHPTRTNLYWVDMNGKIVNQVVNYYAEQARVSISDDGFAAVAGALYQEKDNAVVSLYSPSGGKIWERALEEDQRAAKVNVTSKGSYTILLTTNNRDWLEDHRVEIIDAKGQLQSSIVDFHIVQKIALVDKDKHLFVQGYDGYGLVDISQGAILWTRHEKIRMISPYGAKISPKGDLLFLLLADFEGKPKATYRWRLVSLNAADGTQASFTWLPKEYPSTWNRVFEQITEDRVQILAVQDRIVYSWEKQEGE